MGQYWKPVCLDSNQSLDTWDYGSGLKLMEHSWKNTDVMRVVCRLLMKGQPWHKKHIAWVGDYSDNGLKLTEKCDECTKKETNYDCPEYLKKLVGECDGTYQRFYETSINIRPKVPTEKQLPNNYYVVNHTKKYYVDMDNCPVEEETIELTTYKRIIHPLSLLTAVSNGLGGGDFRGENDLIGTWAGDQISVELEKPEGYMEINPDFKEN
jgi:hypothetical protein